MNGKFAAVETLIAEIASVYRRDATALDLPMLAQAAALLNGLGWRPAVAPVPATLPVLGFLDQALTSARRGSLAMISDGLAAIAPQCCWRQNANYVRDPAMAEFLLCYGYAELVGKAAFHSSDELLCGVMLLGPDTTYPQHRHPAEEVYHVLSGRSEWQRGDGPWRTVAPGSAIHHPPDLAHAARTGDAPLLALYCWTGKVGVAATLGA